MTASVVRVLTRLNVGGPSRQALFLTRALREDFPTILVAGRPKPSEGEMSDPEVPVHYVPLTRSVRPTRDLAALLALRKLLQNTRAQILHTHMAKAGTIGRIAAFTMGRDHPRTVHTFHGHVLNGYFSTPVQQAFLAIERSLAHHTDALVVVSPQIRDQLLDLGIGRPTQYHVLRVGFNLRPYLEVDEKNGAFRSELGIGPDVPLVGSIGRLVPIKDHSTLLRSVERLTNVHLAIIGDGECRRDIEREVSERGLSNRVHFAGWRADLSYVYGDLDAVVLTSRNEGTPAALIEAMASRRPVIATDVGGVAHVVADGRTGLLTPVGDDEMIARQIATVLADKDLARKMAIAGRTDVEARFGEDRLLQDIRELYRDLVSDDPCQKSSDARQDRP